MKKDLDQLIAEFKRFGEVRPLEDDSHPQHQSDLFQEMTWAERGKLLMELIEQRNGSISQKELLHEHIEKLGIANSEEGRQYLRNFLSLFVQQKVLIKKRFKNKTFFLPNRHFTSANIQEYFALLSRPSGENVSYKKASRLKYLKRVKLLKSIIEQKGPLPISRLIDEHIGEFGFTNDSVGRQEALLFFKNAINDHSVQTYKKDSMTWITMSESFEEEQAKPEISHKEIEEVRTQKIDEISGFGWDRGQDSRGMLTRSSFSEDNKLRVDEELLVYRSISHYDAQIVDLDKQFYLLHQEKMLLRKQLTGIDKMISQLYSLSRE